MKVKVKVLKKSLKKEFNPLSMESLLCGSFPASFFHCLVVRSPNNYLISDLSLFVLYSQIIIVTGGGGSSEKSLLPGSRSQRAPCCLCSFVSGCGRHHRGVPGIVIHFFCWISVHVCKICAEIFLNISNTLSSTRHKARGLTVLGEARGAALALDGSHYLNQVREKREKSLTVNMGYLVQRQLNKFL